ncbi:hypothetical protein [Streptomyces niveus]|uniref:hypothetical protein n=1 Tax=Streptomyces niveus TaxID=193462 RepID=UPI003432449B
MSTTRRRLGTGPITPTTDPVTAPATPRLLPVERVEREQLADVEHDQAVTAERGRRRLGSGGRGVA